jgi:hypothetical protein
MRTHFTKLAALAAVALAITGCGDDKGSGATAAAVSSGTVTRFGSVHINGVEWKVSGATLRLDDGVSKSLSGEDSIRADVPRGAVVTVKGRRDSGAATGTATTVEFKSIIEGPMAGNTDAGFTVAGLTVAIDASTVFLGSAGTEISYAGLTPGTRVEVSGVPDSATVLRASMVRAKASTEAQYEAKGYVVGLSGSNFGLSLVSGGAAYLNVTGTVPAGVANGSIVEVKGATFTPGAAGAPGTLAASLIRIEDRLFGDEGDEAEVEGVITLLSPSPATATSTFTVAGQPVSLTSSTRYVGMGNPADPLADLADGIKVEVEGHVRSGTLVAEKVKFKDGVRISATVSGVSATGFTALGKSIAVAPGRTRYDGIAAASNGQFLEIRGYPMIDGTIFAQRVRPETGGNQRPSLQGVATNKSGTTSLTILGINVTTGSSTEHKDSRGGSGSSEKPMTASEFYNAIVLNQTFVKVKWNEGTTDFTTVAREAELEGEDD